MFSWKTLPHASKTQLVKISGLFLFLPLKNVCVCYLGGCCCLFSLSFNWLPFLKSGFVLFFFFIIRCVGFLLVWIRKMGSSWTLVILLISFYIFLSGCLLWIINSAFFCSPPSSPPPMKSYIFGFWVPFSLFFRLSFVDVDSVAVEFFSYSIISRIFLSSSFFFFLMCWLNSSNDMLHSLISRFFSNVLLNWLSFCDNVWVYYFYQSSVLSKIANAFVLISC